MLEMEASSDLAAGEDRLTTNPQTVFLSIDRALHHLLSK